MAHLHVARVDAHPHAQVAAVRPGVAGERLLRSHSCANGGARLEEDDEERVAVGVDLDAGVVRPDLAKDLVVLRQDVAIELTDVLEQSRGPLDVAEQHRYVTFREPQP